MVQLSLKSKSLTVSNLGCKITLEHFKYFKMDLLANEVWQDIHIS